MFKQEHSGQDTIVSDVIKDASLADRDWSFRTVGEFAHRWADIFNREFFAGVLPHPVISFQKTRREVLGHFVRGRSDHGVRFNINLNQQHLGRSDADLLETLAHELVHLYQQVTGTAARSRYHNKAFVRKANEIGLKATVGRGCHDGPPGDPFVALLRKYGVSFTPRKTAASAMPEAVQGGRLHRWQCRCPRPKAVWCGGVLNAVCQNCGQSFERR